MILGLLKEDYDVCDIKIMYENRKVRPKMFTKLANWMEKTTTQTL